MWYKTVAKILENNLGFKRSITDLFLFYRKNELGKVVIFLYVDDSDIIGEEKEVMDVANGLEKKLTI